MGHDQRCGESFEEILRRARSGDRGALEELFQRSRSKLRRASLKRTNGRHPGGVHPSDIAQETAERAFRKFNTFVGSTEAEWLNWLEQLMYSRTVQAVRDAGRKKRAIPGGGPLDTHEAEAAPSPGTSPSQKASQKQEWQILLTHLYELPDEQCEAIKLRYLEDLSLEDAALRMGKTQKSVKGLASRGIETLKLRIQETNDSMLLERIRALRPCR